MRVPAARLATAASSSTVSTSRPKAGRRTTRASMPARAAEAMCGLKLLPSNRYSKGVRRRRCRGVGADIVRIRHQRHALVLLQHGEDVGGLNQRHVARHEQRPGRAPCGHVVAGLGDGAGEIAGGIWEHVGAELGREFSGCAIARCQHDAGQHWGICQRLQHIAQHRQHQPFALCCREHARQALFRANRALERDQRPSAHCTNASTVFASAMRSSSVRITVCAHMVCNPSAATASLAPASTSSMMKCVASLR